MGKTMFPHFLSTEAEYMKAAAFWNSQWEEILRRTGQEAEWQLTSLGGIFGNGDACHDGNPIFSARNPVKRIAVRVIQEDEETAGEVELDWWVDDTQGEEDKQSYRELVVACVLTDRTAVSAPEAIFQWVSKGSTPPTPTESCRAMDPTSPGVITEVAAGGQDRAAGRLL